jgi:glucose-1-phosphate adenylyltransferase
MIGQSSQCVGSDIRRSVIGRRVRIEPGAQLEECVLLDDVHVGPQARLRRVIADRGAVIPGRSRIGYERERDAAHFHVSESGLVVLPHPSINTEPDRLRQAS